MSCGTLAILENAEGQFGKPIWVQGEPVFIKYAVARNLSDLLRNPMPGDLERQITHTVIVFERTEECLPVGDHLAVVYRQVPVDTKSKGL